MKTAELAQKLDEALHSGKPHDKLAVLEAANAYDRSMGERSMGVLVVSKLVEVYQDTPGTLSIRPEYFTQKSKDARWLQREPAKPYFAIGEALGTMYGHTITELESTQDYADAAAKIRLAKIGRRTFSDSFGPVQLPFPTEQASVAEQGLQLSAYLHEIDYSVPGTTYFGDVVHAITTDTSK